MAAEFLITCAPYVQRSCKSSGYINLLLVGLELRGGCLLQCNGESADGVVVRTSLGGGQIKKHDGN